MKDKLIDTLAERFADHEAPVDPSTWEAISSHLAAAASGEGLRQTLQDKFTGHESPVDPHVWTNISSQLGHVPAGAGSAAGWWAAGIAATLVVAGLLFYSASEPTPRAAEVIMPTVSPSTLEVVKSPATITSESLTESRAKEVVAELDQQNAAPKTPSPAAKNVVPVEELPLDPPPTPEGKVTVDEVLQDIVDHYVVTPQVVATEPKPLAAPTSAEMPDKSVVPRDDESIVDDAPTEEQNLEHPATPEPEILIPNAFSPDGNNVNDELQVSGIHYQKAVVRIFSAANSELVFSADNLEAKWNGRKMNSGEPCAPGMYFYALEVTGADGRTWSKGEVVRLFR
jgi:CHU_C Type IX secretion signal domain